MKIVGITGGIGSGKSVVCSIFRALGIPVYNADEEAKKIYEKYPQLSEKIGTEISPDVLDKYGKIDKKKLADVIFSDDSKLRVLNAMVHPLVRKDFQKWCKLHADFPYVLKEAAILFESGAFRECDHVITVISPVELRIQRVKERDKKSRTEIDRIIANQWTDDQRLKKSDYILVNDESKMLIPQVLEIHEQLKRPASPAVQTAKLSGKPDEVK